MNGMNQVIKTYSGPIKGLIKRTDAGKEYFSFQNIPYAKSLQGERRFKDPEPIQAWTETLDATKEGDAAYQFDIWRPDPMITGGDNCLSLNVYSPSISSKKQLTVLVWIHGGGFIFGSGSTLLYGPDYLVEKDVVVVTINYRLNIFGFLSLKDPKLNVPGNAGLKDQTMALKWIKKNISCFGGDPNNITIAGESAGGASVHYHLISPLSEGLFQRAIIMSGSVLNPWAQAPINYDEYLKRLATKLGFNENVTETELFDAIVKVDPLKLVQIDMELVKDDEKYFGTALLSGFLPKVEPYVSDMCFLPKSVKELCEKAWSKDLDVIIGGCANEGLLFYYDLPTDAHLKKLNMENEFFLPPDIRTQLTLTEARRKGNILKKLYFGEENVTSETASKFVEYLGEKHFWHGIYLSVMYRLASGGTGKTYLYRLNAPPSKDTPDFYEFMRNFSNVPHRDGTCHSEDIPFLFKVNFVRRFKRNDDNYLASQRFLGSFVEFTNNGDPNRFLTNTGVPNWNPLCNIESITCMDMGQTIWKETTLPNIDKINVWQRIYDKHYTHAKH